MNLMLRKIDIHDRDKWNDFIQNSVAGNIQHTYEWGEFSLSRGWTPKRVCLENNGEIKVAYPILEKEFPLIGRKFWYLPRGAILNFNNRRFFTFVVVQLKKLASMNRVFAVRISPDIILDKSSDWILEMLQDEGFKPATEYILHKCTIRIDLTQSLEQIFNMTSGNTRSKIRRAERKDVIVKIAETETELKIFYNLYFETLRRNKTDVLPYHYFNALWKSFKEEVTVFLAFCENKPLSGILISLYNGKCCYLFGGSTRRYPTLYSSQLLHWEAIKYAKSKGARIYDLQGIPCIPREEDPEWGIYQFKSGFGGQEVELIGEFDYILLPTLHRVVFDYLYPTYKKLRTLRAKFIH